MKHLNSLSKTFLLLVFLFTATVPYKTFAQAGKPDLSFNTVDQGFNSVNGGANKTVKAIVIQPDGKIIVGGFFTSYNGQPANYLLRLNADGSRDVTFNVGGTGPNMYVKCLALQADGKILVGGIFTAYNGLAVDALICLNADGSANRTYTTTNGFYNVTTIGIQPDGRLLIARKFSHHLIRINTDGTTDPGFITSFSGYGPYDLYEVYATATQVDGKIMAGGYFRRYATGSTFGGIVRTNSNGTRDQSFNDNTPVQQGDPQVDVGTGDVYTIAIQPDGKILIGGNLDYYTTRKLNSNVNGVTRLNADGTIDPSFNPYGSGANGTVYALAFQPDGKILMSGGFTNYNGSVVKRLVRLNTDGTLDNSFNFNKAGADSTIYAMALLPGNNKFLIGGDFSSYNNTGKNRIARIHNCSTGESITNVTICPNQLPYNWNGNNYNAAGTYTKTFNNTTGCDSIATLILTLSASEISGPARACTYMEATGGIAVYSVSAPAGSTFLWSVSKPQTMHILSGQGTNNIQIWYANDFVSGNIYVTVKNLSCNFTIKPALSVTATAPSTPGLIIAGASSICSAISAGNAIRYTIPKVASATSYNWTAQAGTTSITHTNGPGINDTTVTMTFAANFATSAITVQAINECGTSNGRSLNLVRANPPKPGTITGATFVCDNRVHFAPQTGYVQAISLWYSVPAINGTTFNWAIPDSSMLISGQGYSSINFGYPQNYAGGEISVTTINGCGSSAARTLNIGASIPVTPGVITQTNVSSCPGRQYTYSIPAMPANARLLYWYFPNGDSIFTTLPTVTVTYADNAVSGFVSVKGENGCGYSNARKLAINLPSCSGFTSGNKSFPVNTNIILPGFDALDVKISPNPCISDFKLQVITSASEKISVKIFEVQGRLIKEISVSPNQLNSIGADFNTGTYIVEIRQGKNVKSTKLVKF